MMGNGGGCHTLHGHDFAAIHFFAGRNGLENHQSRFVRESLGYLLYQNSVHEWSISLARYLRLRQTEHVPGPCRQPFKKRCNQSFRRSSKCLFDLGGERK